MIWFNTIAAVVGALSGTVIHECCHAAAAELVGGEAKGVGWRGGLTGGPVVFFGCPDDRWRQRVIGAAPLPVAIVIAVIAGFAGPESGVLRWFTLGVVATTALLSPSDLFPSRQTGSA